MERECQYCGIKVCSSFRRGEQQNLVDITGCFGSQLLLSRYKQDLTPDQKAALLDLIRVQKHAGISPEVSRELISGKARGELLEEPVDDDDDDAMSL